MYSSDRHKVFKSLETDEEFRARVKVASGWNFGYASGERLDNDAWSYVKMQRKIIERSTER
jgi:hypothetical protein